MKNTFRDLGPSRSYEPESLLSDCLIEALIEVLTDFRDFVFCCCCFLGRLRLLMWKICFFFRTLMDCFLRIFWKRSILWGLEDVVLKEDRFFLFWWLMSQKFMGFCVFLVCFLDFCRREGALRGKVMNFFDPISILMSLGREEVVDKVVVGVGWDLCLLRRGLERMCWIRW